MRTILLFLAFGLAAGAAQAQIKCWNEGGRRVCGDAPPAGAKVTTLKAPTAPDAPPAAEKDAKKAPLTPAEREQEAKKKQAESQKSAQKAEEDRKNEAFKRDNCDRAKEALASFESGQRVMRTDSKGERYFLDDSQIAAEAARARQIAKDSCS